MRKVTDKFKVSREMLAYVVDSTAAPICVLVPVSTWAVFYAGLFMDAGYAESGQGMALYISAIPYMVYPIVAMLLVPLVAVGIVPALGMMKSAEQRAARGYCATSPLMRAKKRVWSIQRIGFKSTTLCYPLWPCWVLVSGMTWMYRSA